MTTFPNYGVYQAFVSKREFHAIKLVPPDLFDHGGRNACPFAHTIHPMHSALENGIVRFLIQGFCVSPCGSTIETFHGIAEYFSKLIVSVRSRGIYHFYILTAAVRALFPGVIPLYNRIGDFDFFHLSFLLV